MKIDISALRQAINWLAFSAAVSLTVIFIVLYQYSESREKLLVSESMLSSIKQQSESAYADLFILQKRLPKFQDMKRDGLIGKEDRLGWIETLREAAEQLKLQKFEYRIEEQKTFSHSELAATGDYKIMSSQMHLSMQLLHEGDFLNIIDILKSRANGLFYVDQCEFYRLQKIMVTNSASNISAECSLTWFTIHFNKMNIESSS